MHKTSRFKLPQFRLEQLFLFATLVCLVAAALSALVRTEPEQCHTSLAISPNGKLLAASGSDCVQVYDIETRKMIASYVAPNDEIFSAQTIAFVDNDIVCSFSDGRSIQATAPGIFWYSVSKNEVVKFLPVTRFDESAAIAGDRIVIRTRSTATLVNRSQNPKPDSGVTSAVKFAGDFLWLNSDGSELAVYAFPNSIKNPLVHIYDSQSGKLLDTHAGSYDEFRISPDNTKLLTSNHLSLKLLDRATKKPLWEIKNKNYRGVDFSQDGKWILASPLYSNTEVIDASNGKLKFEIPCDPQLTSTGAFSKDGKHLYADDGRMGSKIKIWNLDPDSVQPLGANLGTISAIPNKALQMFLFSIGLSIWSVIWVWRLKHFQRSKRSTQSANLQQRERVQEIDQNINWHLRCATMLLIVGGLLGTFESLKTLSRYLAQTGMFGRMPWTTQALTISICAILILAFVAVLINGLTNNQNWLKSQMMFLICFGLLGGYISVMSLVGLIGILILIYHWFHKPQAPVDTRYSHP